MITEPGLRRAWRSWRAGWSRSKAQRLCSEAARIVAVDLPEHAEDKSASAL